MRRIPQRFVALDPLPARSDPRPADLNIVTVAGMSGSIYRPSEHLELARPVGGLDRHALTEDRIDLSVTKLARLIGRRMARELFEAEPMDDGEERGQRRTSRRERLGGY